MPICIDLRTKRSQAETLVCPISNEMFESVENSLVKGGQFDVKVTITSDPVGLNLAFDIVGKAIVECDRCLDDMEVDIDCEENLKVQFSDHYEDAEDVIYVEEKQTELDIWPFIYDYITLAVPMVHTHADGDCNEEMLKTLSQYMVAAPDSEEE